MWCLFGVSSKWQLLLLLLPSFLGPESSYVEREEERDAFSGAGGEGPSSEEKVSLGLYQVPGEEGQ